MSYADIVSRAEWWALYDDYLLTDIWRDKRVLVMERAHGICEGCGVFPAVQVHHVKYPGVGYLPGSPQWVRKEMLFDLRAVCIECHQDLHETWRGS